MRAVTAWSYAQAKLARSCPSQQNRISALLRAKPAWEGFAMTSKFAVGDKVDQAFSNHAEGTVVAIFRGQAGECRYAVEMSGHRTIQIASEGSLTAHVNSVV
jgi:hypothetical protein